MQPRASTGLYPRTSSRRGFSEARWLRSPGLGPSLRSRGWLTTWTSPACLFWRMLSSTLGGHLRSRMATLKQEEILKRQGQGFGTATVPRPHTSALPYICSNPGCGGRFASSQRTRCFLCWTVRRLLMDPPAKWLSISESFKEDFKYRYGRPQTDYERKVSGTSLSVTLNKSNPVEGAPPSGPVASGADGRAGGGGPTLQQSLHGDDGRPGGQGAEQRPHTVRVVFSHSRTRLSNQQSS